jgi:hypothetical protein
MGGPNKSFRNYWISLVINAQPAMIYQPCPGPLDHPPTRYHFERMRCYPADYYYRDVMNCGAMLREGSFEP